MPGRQVAVNMEARFCTIFSSQCTGNLPQLFSYLTRRSYHWYLSAWGTIFFPWLNAALELHGTEEDKENFLQEKEKEPFGSSPYSFGQGSILFIILPLLWPVQYAKLPLVQVSFLLPWLVPLLPVPSSQESMPLSFFLLLCECLEFINSTANSWFLCSAAGKILQLQILAPLQTNLAELVS